MASMNAIQRWLEFYKQNGAGGPRYVSAPHGSVSQIGAVPVENSDNALAAAMRQAELNGGGDAPDFFADEGSSGVPGYVAPQPISGVPMDASPSSPAATNRFASRVGGVSPQREPDSPYERELRRLLFTPGGFEGSAGYNFALDQGSQAIQRAMAAKGMRGSGNEAIELTKYAAGTAGQEYGNAIDRLARITAQDRGANVADRGAALAELSSDRNFALGSDQNAIARARNASDYDLGLRRQALGESSAENEFNINRARASTDAYGARTNRGVARSNDYFRRMSRY